MLNNELVLLYQVFLRDAQMAHDGILVQQSVDRILKGHESGRADHGNRLWLLLNSEVWYRMFIDGTSQEELSEKIVEMTSR